MSLILWFVGLFIAFEITYLIFSYQKKDPILDRETFLDTGRYAEREHRILDDNEEGLINYYQNQDNLSLNYGYICDKFVQYMNDRTRPATKDDYLSWLNGFIENGGVPNDDTDWFFDDTTSYNMRVAEHDMAVFCVDPNGMQLIVKEGVKLNIIERDIDNHFDEDFPLFKMEDFTCSNTLVPTFKDAY